MKALAIIPARKGSLGVPDKNIRDLLGKPVIAYTIETALAAQRIDRIAVTTDDERIKPICRLCCADGRSLPMKACGPGLTLIERPAQLASDTARIDDAMRHCCRQMESQHQYRPDAVVLLYANVPVRANGIIDKAIEHLSATGADSVQTMAPVGKYNPCWLYQLDGDRATKYTDNKIYQRQELPAVYAIDGAVAAVKYECLMAAEGDSDPHAFWGNDRRGLIQLEHDTVDIDTLSDLYRAEAVLRERVLSQHDPDPTQEALCAAATTTSF